jgi:hypothetical protein
MYYLLFDEDSWISFSLFCSATSATPQKKNKTKLQYIRNKLCASQRSKKKNQLLLLPVSASLSYQRKLNKKQK